MIINYMNQKIDTKDLPSKEGLLDFLQEKGANEAEGLTELREMQYERYGMELVWRYPMCDGTALGSFIVPVQEGFLYIPYDSVDTEKGEILLITEAELLDQDAVKHLIEDWQFYTEGLIGALKDMQTALKMNKK